MENKLSKFIKDENLIKLIDENTSNTEIAELVIKQIENDFDKLGLSKKYQDMLFKLSVNENNNNPIIEIQVKGEKVKPDKMDREFNISDDFGIVATLNKLAEICLENSNNKFLYTLPNTLIDNHKRQDLFDNMPVGSNIIEETMNGVIKNSVLLLNHVDKISQNKKEKIKEQVENSSFTPHFDQQILVGVFVKNDLENNILIRQFEQDGDLYFYFKEDGLSHDLENKNPIAIFDKNEVIDKNQIKISTMNNAPILNENYEIIESSRISVKPIRKVF